MPDPDLLIRTAGEMRVSNFLLWQISYAEIWVTRRPLARLRRAAIARRAAELRRPRPAIRRFERLVGAVYRRSQHRSRDTGFISHPGWSVLH